MAKAISKQGYLVSWLIIIPTIAWFYIGLFLTMSLWYPAGVSASEWQSHLLHFTVVYIIWLAVFFSYRLFDVDTLRTNQTFFGRLAAVTVICFLAAALYFYFQPALLITPRRFLVAHVLITASGIFLWYIIMRRAVTRTSRHAVYVHSALNNNPEVEVLIRKYQFLGLDYSGDALAQQADTVPRRSIVILPSGVEASSTGSEEIFKLRNSGVRFIQYHDLFENLTRSVNLDLLTDLWFLHSIDYSKHRISDFVKRIFDLFAALAGGVIFVATFPFIAALIKLSSEGPVLFVQPRVGQFGRAFRLYKYRTMTTDSSNNTWANSQQKVTGIGKFLRATRLDELPQVINIFKGEMSVVGPRPEQVGIVEELKQLIPYYDERHSVKPGLTGWGQLHVYASSIEETRRKLQYDLYYIKHRSFLFDMEIIIKTVYNIISFAGR